MPSARSRRSRKSRNSIAENEHTADEPSQNEGAVQSDDLQTRKARREAYVELEERLREGPTQAAVHSFLGPSLNAVVVFNLEVTRAALFALKTTSAFNEGPKKVNLARKAEETGKIGFESGRNRKDLRQK